MSKRKSSISSILSSAKNFTNKFWDKYNYDDDYSAKSDYWLKGSLFDKKKSFFEDDHASTGDKYDYFALAQYQRAITNFVHIMTGRPDIKVSYENTGDSFTDGRTITLSASIKEKDFDSNVGLALHESSHIIYSDFKLLQETINSAMYRPHETVRDKLIDKKGNPIFREGDTIDLSSLIKPVFNIIEDLYIDAMTYASAPGYRGYYKALYHKFFGDEQIVLGFYSKDYSKITQQNYLFHLCNIRNPERNLKALPDLDLIWDTLNLINIRRLSTAQSRVDLAWKVVSIIVENTKNNTNEQHQDAEHEQHQDAEHEQHQDADDVEYKSLSDKELDKLAKMFAKQLELINGDVKKSKMSKSAIENVSALSSVDMSSEFTGKGFTNKGIKTLVIRRLTDNFLESNIAGAFGIRSYGAYGMADLERYINLGKILAKKLQIRNEERTLVSSRLKSGSIDQRLLHEIGADKYEVFKKININQHKPSYIHISIDASGSMSGTPFNEAVKFATMFATASKFIRNIHVVISVRTTTASHNKSLKNTPFIMYIFDSKINGLNHVRKLFPKLSCPGTTPEGLTFEAIMKEVKKDSANTDAFFINICDGEPCYTDNNYIRYGGTEAKQHSKKQIDRMMSFGINTLNYFIGGKYGFRAFKTTYPVNSFHLESANEIQNIVKVMNSNLLRSANH